MPSKKELLRKAELYLILDRQVNPSTSSLDYAQDSARANEVRRGPSLRVDSDPFERLRVSPEFNRRTERRLYPRPSGRGLGAVERVNDDGRLLEIARESIRHGVDIVQLRDKVGTARDTLRCFKGITRAVNGRVPVIINDRVDLAIAAGADGVHLGQDDVPVKDARRMLGTKAIIGVSCQSYEHARQAQLGGADYIGFGSVFKTLTKPGRDPMNLDLLKKVIREAVVPVFAIGGITAKNIAVLLAIGVKHFAVCRAICTARNIGEAVSDIKKEICGRSSMVEPQLPKLVT